MRNSILDKYDGEELSLKGGDKSLLSWVKIFDVNPYTLKSSPYEDIPNGFLLYRSAYPIRYNKEDHVLKTTPTSMAFNLRIYRLSVGAMRCLNIKTLDCDYFDVWRDIEYYRWVNTIIKRKISPNFLNLILHVLDNKSKIGFKDLDNIKKSKNRDVYELQEENSRKINDKFKLTLDEIIYGPSTSGSVQSRKPVLPGHSSIQKRVSVVKNIYNDDDDLTRKISLISKSVSDLEDKMSGSKTSKPPTQSDLTEDSGKVLVALTEAPNTNIIKWNSKIYQSYGTVKKMVATGYHKPEIWNSILFQLLYSCAVMEKEGIYFNNFSLKNNVFIKDVQTDGTGNSCWVYKVNNIEYYVPNYGYMLVIDSNYADITESSSDMQYKIYGNIFKQNANKTNFSQLLKNQLSTEFTVDKFKEFGANELDDDVNRKINDIMSELSKSSNISEILPNCFKEFVNSKVGKLLTKLEKESLNLLAKPDYREGAIMVRQKRYDEYDWVVYLGNDGNKKKVIHRNNKGDLEVESVFSSSLYSYPENVLPEDKTIIETYTYFN
jgi:hypothetical protein